MFILGFKSAADLSQRFPKIDLSFKPSLTPHESESDDADCVGRSARAAREIYQRYQGNRLFVGHGASVAGILQAFIDRSSYVGLCTLSKIVKSKDATARWRADFIGDAAHLSDKTNLRAY